MSMPLESEEPAPCTWCEKSLQHCHGTAIVDDVSHVCSDDPDCTLGVDEHWFISLEGD